MCGIAGIINKNGSPIKSTILKKMINISSHRGPDDIGYYYYNNIGLAHVRLSIIDISSKGHQPMINRESNLIIIYNGEIYNYNEIRNLLEKKGYIFSSNTDTEVILDSYKEWGESCIKLFNGMWSFCIFDKLNDKMFLSRDRFGIKPLYIYNDKNIFAFASEIKQILEITNKRKLNQDILLDYLIMGLEDHTDETFFTNISKLRQSHNLIYDINSNKYEIKKYYNLRINNDIKRLKEKEVIYLFNEKLINAIRLRLISDVKVGTCLSGGLDSSSISSIAAKFYNQNHQEYFNAITAVSEQKEFDESYYAKMVVDNSSMKWLITKPLYNDFVGIMNEVFYTLEEPFGSPSLFMYYYVMKTAKDNNIKVLLDGQGGDETLLGYERYYINYIMGKSLFNSILNMIQASNHSRLSLTDILKYYIYFSNINIRKSFLKKRAAYVKSDYLIDYSFQHLSTMNIKDINTFQISEITKYQLPHLLKYEDKTSMRHSVETRVPFIDHKLVETTISINANLKIKNGYSKYILRKVAEQYIPHSIAWRKNKFGYESPIDIWMNMHEKIITNNILKSEIINKYCNLNSKIIQNLHKITKWRLFNVSKWENIYNVSK